MKNSLSARRRLLIILTVVVIVLLAAVYIGMPTVMAVAAVTPSGGSPGDPPESFESVSLTTRDGVRLAAWYAESQNGVAIILVHGAGSGRESTGAYARMLHDNGFGVLAVSLRGYSESEGRINRLGWNGTQDIGAAVDYLVHRDEVEAIGALGLSMGGEVLLGAAFAYPEIRAVVADGATFRAVNEYTALSFNEPLYRNFTHRVFSFMVGLFSGDSPPEPPLLESIRLAETTAFLFIAAGNDTTEIDFNTFYHETLPDRSRLWVIPNIEHTGGFAADPDAYTQRVVEFYNQTLTPS